MLHKRSWLLGAVAAVVLTAATVTGVALLGGDRTTGDREPDVAAPTDAPSQRPSPRQSASQTAEPSPSDAPSPSRAPVRETVPVYYVGDTSRGPRLYREFHRVDTGGQKVSAAVNLAVSVDPDDPDYRTDWPLGTTAVKLDRPPADVITVDVHGKDLRARPAGMSGDQADLAVEQVVYTAQAAAQSRSAVQFLVNGRRTDTLLGVPVSEPRAQGEAMDVLAQVWIIDPGEGAGVTAPFQVRGLAAAFEAQVQWRLMAGGDVVEEGFTTAEVCCTMAPYSFEVDAPPGDYTLVVNDSDPSGGEGTAPWEDSKQVTVLP